MLQCCSVFSRFVARALTSHDTSLKSHTKTAALQAKVTAILSHRKEVSKDFRGKDVWFPRSYPWIGACWIVFLLWESRLLNVWKHLFPSIFCVDLNCCTSQNVCEKLKCQKKTKKLWIWWKHFKIFSFWHFRTEFGIRLCQLHWSKGCRESHQHIKWAQASDQNDQGNRHGVPS